MNQWGADVGSREKEVPINKENKINVCFTFMHLIKITAHRIVYKEIKLKYL